MFGRERIKTMDFTLDLLRLMPWEDSKEILQQSILPQNSKTNQYE